MRRLRCLAAAVLALAATGASYQEGLLACRGSFGRFANGFLVSRPSYLNFVVDWQTPRIATEAGRSGTVVSLTPLELVFDIAYDGYRARYRVSRVDGKISETSSLGGVFYGVCEVKTLETRF